MPLVELGSCVEDERGVIQNVIVDGRPCMAVITGKKGSVRSNHWHKTDGHMLWMVKGQVRYLERPRHGGEIRGFKMADDAVHTRPYMVHRVDFVEDSTLVSLYRPMTPEQYAAQTVAEEL